GDIDISGTSLLAGKELELLSSTGNVVASSGDYESGRDMSIEASLGQVNIGGSNLLAGRGINLRTGQGVAAAGSIVQARGTKGKINVTMDGGSADFSGAVLTADRLVEIDAQAQTDQGVNLTAAQVRTFAKGNIILQTSGTLDVTNSIIEADPPGAI